MMGDHGSSGQVRAFRPRRQDEYEAGGAPSPERRPAHDDAGPPASNIIGGASRDDHREETADEPPNPATLAQDLWAAAKDEGTIQN
jgi:hypothetical protein